MIIPDKILLFFTPLLILERSFIPLDPWWDPLAGAVFGFVLLLLIAIISNGGMGGGDIKLFFVIGLVLGFKLTLITFILSSFIGAVFGVFSIVIGKHKKKDPIPFGPFIAIGGIIAYFYGLEIIHWYFSIFF
jgi:leader peptidase (prepilin peptidase)/N-methyltransferase